MCGKLTGRVLAEPRPQSSWHLTDLFGNSSKAFAVCEPWVSRGWSASSCLRQVLQLTGRGTRSRPCTAGGDARHCQHARLWFWKVPYSFRNLLNWTHVVLGKTAPPLHPWRVLPGRSEVPEGAPGGPTSVPGATLQSSQVRSPFPRCGHPRLV